jgi:hypothetical protein
MDKVIEGLVAAGWQREPPRPGAEQRVVHARADGSRLVVETRDEGLWLVIDEPGDRRVLGLQPTAPQAAVAQAIVVLQDTASIASYFSAYGALGDVGEVSIIAWEQFDPGWQ